MKRQAFVFTWDADDLGPEWFNIDNLRQLLYSDAMTLERLLQVESLPLPAGELQAPAAPPGIGSEHS